MEDFMWGELPKQRTRKEERFSTPVLTLNAITRIGAGRKIVFNKAAQEALGVVGEDRISFGYDSTNNVIAVRKSTTEKSLVLTKTCTVSNKEWYEFIAKHFGLNIERENNFDLVVTKDYFTLSLHRDLTEEPLSPVIEFHTTELGEVTEEVSLEADLSGIPTNEKLGIEEVVEENFLDVDPLVDDEPVVTSEMLEPSADDDSWN